MIDTDVLESFAPLLCEMEEQSCELDLDNFIIAGTKLLDVIFSIDNFNIYQTLSVVERNNILLKHHKEKWCENK